MHALTPRFAKIGIALVASAALIGVAGCGGGGSSSADFASKADAICKDATDKGNALTQPTSTADLKPFLDKSVPIYEDAINQIKGLTPPDSDKTGYDAWVKTLDAQLANIKQAQSQVGSDPNAAVATVKSGAALNTKADQQARSIGLTECAKNGSGGSSGSSGSS